MAAIDFPAGPTLGQTFSAANGVVYTWNGTLWLANAASGAATVSDTPPGSPTANQLWFNSALGELYIYYNDGNTTQWVPATPNMSLPTTPGGDFTASGSNFALSTTAQAMIMPVIHGNSGSYYNPSNGRWTPPAGRYNIYGAIVAYNNTVSIGIQVAIRKNGVSVLTSTVTAAANAWGVSPIETQVDANGTDYFDLWGNTVSGNAIGSQGYFGAFPISGVKGPPGDAGMLQMVSFETGAMATGTTVLPVDDTIPQQTEGDQYMTLAITPKSATSKLVIDVLWMGSTSAGGAIAIVTALFQDATANALAATWGISTATNAIASVELRHTMVSGTTSTTTFKIRAGTGTAGTTTFNGAASGRLLGGVMASSIVIQEWP